MDSNLKNANSIQENLILLEPLIFKGIISNFVKNGTWSCLKWSKNDWLHLFKEDKLKMILNRRRKGGSYTQPQWEYQCLQTELLFRDLLDFEKGMCIKINEIDYNCKDYWMYFSYFYLKDFSNISHINNAVSWGDLGFPNLTAKHSTLWIGTEGSNTPCHIDTYGWNIVVQLYGSKRWTLFPKSESKYLYQTRVPYEESSVYSEVGFPFPDLNKYKLLFNTNPHTVVLQPGDVLIVPKHWWHFVECLDFSISINTWISSETDDEDRIKETIAMFQIGHLSRTFDSSTILQILNPNMLHIAVSSSEELFQILINAINMIKNKSNIKDNKGDIKSLITYLQSKTFNINMRKVECLSFENYYKTLNKPCDVIPQINYSSQVDDDNDILKSIVNSFIDDRVLSCIKSVLMEKLKHDE